MPAEPVTPFPFSTVIVVSRGGGALSAAGFGFSFSATWVAFCGDSTSGCVNSCTALSMFCCETRRSKLPFSSIPSSFDWKKWPGGSEYAKSAYSRTVSPSSSELPPDADLDVLRDRLDHLRQVERARCST